LPSSDSADRSFSVGSALRESRESHGISLEEASRVTRIGKNYLTALEEGTFDTLPNPAYVKGFLRAYAAFLGLSGDEIVARYEMSIPATPSAHHPEEEIGGSGAPVTGDKTAPRRSRWVVPLILLAFVVVAAYFFEDKGPRPAKAPLPLDASPAQPLAVPVLPPRSSAQGHQEANDLAAEKGKGAARPADAESQGEGIVLKLKVNQDCWLTITIDDAVSQQYDLKAGDLIEWKGDRVFALDMGNAGGIEAEFNGKPLKPFGEPGKPAHVILQADGTSQ
jgi:cytoskeleton protein RodZ